MKDKVEIPPKDVIEAFKEGDSDTDREKGIALEFSIGYINELLEALTKRLASTTTIPNEITLKIELYHMNGNKLQKGDTHEGQS